MTDDQDYYFNDNGAYVKIKTGERNGSNFNTSLSLKLKCNGEMQSVGKSFLHKLCDPILCAGWFHNVKLAGDP